MRTEGLERRGFLGWALGLGAGGVLGACAGEAPPPGPDDPAADAANRDDPDDGGGGGGDDARSAAFDAAACTMTVVLYDVYAMALYFDGGLGPRTGAIRVAAVAAGADLPMEFWHGHGGQQHRYTVLPTHFAALRRRERVMVQTTEVDGHSHMLFIDPVDPQWRVEGAQPQTIPAC